MAHVQIVLCPKCGGQKHVNKPPWIAGDQNTWTSNDTKTYTCPVCDGQGYLLLNAEVIGTPGSSPSHSDAIREAGRAEGGEPGAGARVQPDPELTGYSGEVATALDKPESSRPPASPTASDPKGTDR